MDELVSIIVPVYNVSEYIENCVRSIMIQTYQNIEIVIVNDGSTDGSLDIIKKLEKEDLRIKVINKSNAGAASTRNAGMKEAKGKYILFIDGDDTIRKDAVRLLYDALKEYRADIAIMRVAQIYNDGHTEQFNFCNDQYSIVDLTNKNWFFNDSSIFHPVWNKLYNREIIRFEFNEKLKRNEDIEFNGKIYCNANKMVVLNEPLYFQLQRASSLCHTGRKTEEEIESVKVVYDNVISYGDFANISENKKKELMRYLYFRIDILFQMIIYDDSGYNARKNHMRLLRKYFPKWKYSLVNDIKSSAINIRFLLFKILYDLKLYFLLYHYKDFTNLIRKFRRTGKTEKYKENMFN